MNYLNALLLCDFYKISHRIQYPENTQVIYSTLTPRTNKYAPSGIDSVVSLGFQKFAHEYLVNFFNENFFKRDLSDALNDYVKTLEKAGFANPETQHIEKLHALGYLPLRVRVIPEGTLVPVTVPICTIENTHPDFFWLTNYFETLISCSTWQCITSATIAHEYRKIGDQYAVFTCESKDHVDYQFHDFSMRGLSSLASAVDSGIGHLASFKGTDTIPAIQAIEHFYESRGIIGTSIPATEHSVMSANAGVNGVQDEYETYRRLIQDLYPSGFVSIVSDTYDFWKVVTETLPKLKGIIESRDGKVVIRPDSGDPVDILCGTVSVKPLGMHEALVDGVSYFKKEDGSVIKKTVTGNVIRWEEDDRTPEQKGLIEVLYEIFGGRVNSKGFIELNPKIGAIYGDSITLERAESILKHLLLKGFASSNVVFGVGSFTYQFNTRDTFGFAVKSTAATIDSVEVDIFKDPKTDSAKMKKSQRGRVLVYREGDTIKFKDGLKSYDDFTGDIMQTIFENGALHNVETFDVIRSRLNQQ